MQLDDECFMLPYIDQKDLIIHEEMEKPIQNKAKSSQLKNKENHSNKSNIMQQYIQPTVYNIIGGQNSIVRIGPQGVQVQPNRPTFPPVYIQVYIRPVQCKFCQFKQIVPGNVDHYRCCNCKESNEAQPKFGIFVCYVCHAYHIHCNICTSVNAVSKNPPKRAPITTNLKEKKVEEKELRQLSDISHDQNGDMITVAKLQQDNLQEF